MGSEMVVEADQKYPMTAMGVVAQVRLIAEVMKSVMKDGTHYGVIPGCQKPSLWKPGAEKLLVTFRIATESAVEDLSTHDEARYRVTRRATAISNGAFLGSATGECSSNEEKYKWRGIVCAAEYEATPEDRRREKFKRDGTSFKQVRTNHADVANTILKMADKRSYVALALQTTAASDLFTQDLEDLPAEIVENIIEGERPARAVAAPTPKVTPAVAQVFGGKSDDTPTGTVEDVTQKPTSTGGTRYGVKISGDFYGTFTDALGIKAISLKGKAVRFTWTANAKKPEYRDLQTIDAA